MAAELACIAPHCRARFHIDQVIYVCPRCGSLLEVALDLADHDATQLARLWRERRMSNRPIDQSGVWRYRELLPPFSDGDITTLREGDTPLLQSTKAAQYAGLDAITFKHQGFNPTGSFKDNGMTCGVAQARKLGMQRVACVSTGNTSASMSAYAAAAGMEALIFLPHGNISFGKLAQALEYGAQTFQIEANFDEILALVRELAIELDIYLLNSINPFRIEGQKTIMAEMLDGRDWQVPDWVVVPGGNLGNVSAFGKALRELRSIGLIDKLPRLAVVQAHGASPFYDFTQRGGSGQFVARAHPETLATAIRIGDPVSWPKAHAEVQSTDGVVERVTEQEIADAKAVIGHSGIGCEPASAATLAGIRKLTAAGTIARGADVVAILTGNVLKDTDYIFRYHTRQLTAPNGDSIIPQFANEPVRLPHDRDAIRRAVEKPVVSTI